MDGSASCITTLVHADPIGSTLSVVQSGHIEYSEHCRVRRALPRRQQLAYAQRSVLFARTDTHALLPSECVPILCILAPASSDLRMRSAVVTLNRSYSLALRFAFMPQWPSVVMRCDRPTDLMRVLQCWSHSRLAAVLCAWEQLPVRRSSNRARCASLSHRSLWCRFMVLLSILVLRKRCIAL